MPNHHLVIGAGAVGQSVARLLANSDKSVVLATRSGTDLEHPLIRPIQLDAADVSALMAQAEGAEAIYNCANPRYSRWAEAWPPLAHSILAAAEASGAVLATASNLYGYANPQAPMTENDPLAPSSTKGQIRVDMWNAALESHEAGRARVTEARGSDYLGPLVGANGHMADRAIPRLLRGKSVSVLGDPDAPHSWTAVADMASTLITIAAEERAWGQAWHVPTAPPLTARELVGVFCREAGIPPVETKQIPRWLLGLIGRFNTDLAAVAEMTYQFDQPFIVDSTAFTAEFGIKATPIEQTVGSIIEHYRS